MAACPACGFESDLPHRFCPECGVESMAGPHAGEQRKTVTVLFCDLTGSTALGESLDPERLRVVLARYFDAMRAIVERHGGTVEKFIGDAVMAVFGVPTVHEDDALRAVRAAVEMRDVLPELGLQGRIGVMTGEVVTGTAERLVTGDPVNVAARLEQAATPGTVLIGQPTLALVRDAVEIEAVAPLTLKGKTEPVPAYLLLHVLDTPERRHDAQFVGRERELALVQEAWERVQAEQRCELVTIVGEAGVGKSRLVVEVLASIEAIAVRGRCLPYGEGITYWPVVEVLKQLDILPPDEVAAAAIRSLLGQSEAATSPEEIAWAFRRTLEHAASTRPLVVVLDDIQWGEETFRDLIEHVALLSSGAPILLLCMARPELIERHPTWPVTFRLAPLDEEEVDELIADRIPGELGDRIAHAAGGNPLFIEEMLAMAAESDSEVVVPPTLHALLAARLDQLEAAERNVLEWGAIEGETFHRGSVQALAPDETQITPRLAALVRKQFLRPDKALLPGEDGFRFRHLLVREAAYETLPKATRADLHERFADWLEHHGEGLVELDEILGYHLEQAWHYRTELGLSTDDDLGAAARLRLGLGGHRAQARSDYNAAVNLFERAIALVPPPAIDLALEAGLIDALFWAGKGGDAIGRAESLIERASAAGNAVGELCGAIQAGILRCFLEPEGESERLGVVVEQGLPVLEAAGDHVALYIAYQAVGQVANTRALVDGARDAYDRSASHARHAGLPDTLLGWRAAFRFAGTTPVPEVLAWLDENEPREGRNHWLRARRAGALAMIGRFDEAKAIVAETRAELAERGSTFKRASLYMEFAEIFLLVGDPAAAAEFGAEACRLFDEQAEKSMLSTAAGQLARALYALDRLDEADVWTRRATELGASDDVWTQLLWRQVRALILARRGRHAEAEPLGREAVALCEETDLLDAKGDAQADLAEVLLLGGKRAEAAAALEQALERYERKGNLVSAGRASARLAELRDAAL
jgi:class 3 adenylate cyclase/tetratricopeptide (TPR) repeat protein